MNIKLTSGAKLMKTLRTSIAHEPSATIVASVNEDEKYRAYLRPVYDAHAVEGSLAADNIMAAKMIREKAKEIGSTELASEKLATINLALGVVLRPNHASHNSAATCSQVAPDDNGDE
jgi:hypothetical protein